MSQLKLKPKFILSLMTLIILSLLLKRGISPLPALGPLLDPFNGIWQSANKNPLKSKDQVLPGLKQPVEIIWDKSGIPHIQAKTTEDLYWTQGYLTASERLFQMELQARSASGRLSEWVGPKALPLDRFHVSMGLREAARLFVEDIKKRPQIMSVMTSYISGVNAFIEQLNPRGLPPEYKLLNVKPEKWSLLKVAYLAKMMAVMLGGRSNDLEMTALKNQIGLDHMEKLFPDYPYKNTPIIDKKWTLKKPPKDVEVFQFKSVFDKWPKYLKPKSGNGSNSWAIHRNKTASGHTLLANDTHLTYSLPAIWYEIQLTAPGTSSYGVSLVGAPGILIGFNQQLGWAITNSTVDVMDWYEFDVRKTSEGEEYFYQNKWHKVTSKPETIKIKHAKSEHVQVKWTQLGVVVDEKPGKYLVLKWLGHKPGPEIETFINLNAAKSVKQCRELLKKRVAPSQNIICADQTDISMSVTGAMVKKWQGQGKYVLPGGQMGSEWGDVLAFEEEINELNPQRNFVFSANQHPTDNSYPYYYGGMFRDPFRAGRIKEVLSSKDKLTIKDMVQLQNDVTSVSARSALKKMLVYLAQNVSDLTPLEKKAYLEVQRWGSGLTKDNVAASIYHYWWKEFKESYWSLWYDVSKTKLRPMDSTLLKHLYEGSDKADDPTFQKLTLKSFKPAIQQLSRKFGSDLSQWLWGRVRPTDIPHLARIPGWGIADIHMGGDFSTVMANKGRHGAVWKMVVEFDETGVQAVGNLPGGISGNPLHKSYAQFVDAWSKGKMRDLYFYKTGDNIIDLYPKKISLTPGKDEGDSE